MKTLLLIIVLFFIFFNQNTYVDVNQYQSEEIHVEVKGEVVNPGVYTVNYNAKIKDLIELSGGYNENADTSGINQSKTLKNEDVIVIAKKSEQKKISINTANVDELVLLPGIGESTANKIIEYRNEFGPFQTLEDIQKIKGIKSKLYEKIKEFITL